MSADGSADRRVSLHAALAVYVPTALVAAIGLWFAAPAIEAKALPVLVNDHVNSVRVVDADLCWLSSVVKARAAEPVSVSWNMRLTDTAGATATYAVAPRRVSGAQAPYAPFVNLPVGPIQPVGWCVPLPPGVDVRRVEVTSDWLYRTHPLWLVPVTRTTVFYERPIGG